MMKSRSGLKRETKYAGKVCLVIKGVGLKEMCTRSPVEERKDN